MDRPMNRLTDGWTDQWLDRQPIIEMRRMHLKMLIAKCLIAQLNLKVD